MMLKFVELDLTNSQRLGVILTPILLSHHFQFLLQLSQMYVLVYPCSFTNRILHVIWG
jgi:hypothetical protein